MIYTIGFTKHSAEQFFECLKKHRIESLIDVRLNNVSQLAGFAKRDDLKYFLDKICGIEYRHETLLAPTQEMLDGYKKQGVGWPSYRQQFLSLLSERQVEKKLSRALFDRRTVLLCSELKAEQCHRSVVVDYLNEKWHGVSVEHL